MGDSHASPRLSRREFLSAGSATVVPSVLMGAASETNPAGYSAPTRSRGIEQVEALTFDVFGTVVDWRSSIIREGQLFSKSTGLQVDWARFADGWASRYGRAVARVRKGEIAWTTIDNLNRTIVDELLQGKKRERSFVKAAVAIRHVLPPRLTVSLNGIAE